jgi:hypothetical protein
MATNEKLTKVLEGKKIDSVRQRGSELDIDFTDGTTLSVKLSGATGSITVSGENDTTIYAG